MKLELGSVKLNLFKAHIKVKGGSLADIDTTSSPITYKVSFSDLSVNVRSILPLIFGNVLIDSIKINNPVACCTMENRYYRCIRRPGSFYIAGVGKNV